MVLGAAYIVASPRSKMTEKERERKKNNNNKQLTFLTGRKGVAEVSVAAQFTLIYEDLKKCFHRYAVKNSDYVSTCWKAAAIPGPKHKSTYTTHTLNATWRQHKAAAASLRTSAGCLLRGITLLRLPTVLVIAVLIELFPHAKVLATLAHKTAVGCFRIQGIVYLYSLFLY